MSQGAASLYPLMEVTLCITNSVAFELFRLTIHSPPEAQDNYWHKQIHSQSFTSQLILSLQLSSSSFLLYLSVVIYLMAQSMFYIENGLFQCVLFFPIGGSA